MAFGFGFNKQKVLASAEKFVQQGKLQNAISEYEKILKADPKDLTVMNTVGDLYARLGENEKAAECFKNVGDAYAGQGFTVKAIAMYKKLSKLRSSTESVLRLAELYTQQGLFNDARAQYLQVAEDFLKSGQMDQAVRIFQKTLEMDPENVPMRMRLAEAYVRMGKKDEAWQLLSTAAETLRSKGQLTAADDLLKRMLKLDPNNNYALVLRGRAAAEKGDFASAIDALSKVPDLDNNAEGLRTLFQAYLQNKDLENAASLVSKLANVHNDIAPAFDYAAALVEEQNYREAVQVYSDYADQMLRADSAKLFQSARSMLQFVQDDPETLEQVLAIFQKGGDNTQLTDIYELLAHSYVQSGAFKKAQEYYQKLMELEPANQMHASNYQQVTEKLGAQKIDPASGAPEMISSEEGAGLIDELEATAPAIEQRYENETEMAVTSALTDAELFISYNMPNKALGPLITALPKAPRDLRLNQRLASLHTRNGRFAEAAACLRTLESIYHDAGHAEEASRYGDLAAKYEQRSRPASADVPARKVHTGPVQDFEISAPSQEHGLLDGHSLSDEAPVAETSETAAPSGVFFGNATAAADTSDSPAVAEPEIAEESAAVDWEQDFSVEAPQATSGDESAAQPEAAEVEVSSVEDSEAQPPPNWDESIEEVRFYMGQGMIEQAEEILARLEALAPSAPKLAVLRRGIESAKASAQASAVPDISLDEAGDSTPEIAPAKSTHSPPPQPWPVQAPASHRAQEMKAKQAPEPLPEPVLNSSEPAAAPEIIAKPAAHKYGPGTLDEFVADLEASLGNDFLSEPSPPAAVPAIQAAPVTPPPIRETAAVQQRGSAPVPAARAAAASASASSGAPAITPPPVMPLPMADSGLNVDLTSMFGELKQELEHGAEAADEDPETHYNLGVAFREMGLLDEAIGELQKVCHYLDRGKAFPHVMQTYTWLAQCFLEKGIPEVAARWYEKALKLPNLDQETRTALHYELASALENAGQKPAALNNFLEVYSSNIDYRDVAERIKALRT